MASGGAVAHARFFSCFTALETRFTPPLMSQLTSRFGALSSSTFISAGPFNSFGSTGLVLLRSQQRPNQSLEPTAGRYEVDINFKKQFPKFSRLAAASGGSALSR
jgi:hypothetical protein